MSTNGYSAQEADMYRLYGKCPSCGNKRFFLKRIIVKIPSGGNAISPNHFCRHCRGVIIKTLSK